MPTHHMQGVTGVGCPLCQAGLDRFGYKDVLLLSQFISPQGYLFPRRYTGRLFVRGICVDALGLHPVQSLIHYALNDPLNTTLLHCFIPCHCAVGSTPNCMLRPLLFSSLGICPKMQRRIAASIKRSRKMGQCVCVCVCVHVCACVCVCVCVHVCVHVCV